MHPDEEPAQVPRRPHRGLDLFLAVIVGVIGGLYLGSSDPGDSDSPQRGSGAGDDPTHIDGWVEAPDGVDPTTTRVVAWRDGYDAGSSTPAPDGSFRVHVSPGGPVDLHVSDWQREDGPPQPSGSQPVSEPTHAIEGELRGLPLGARNVRLPLARVPLLDAMVRVYDADGAPQKHCLVWISSHGDMVARATDRSGVARFERLPPRLWRAVATPSGPLGSFNYVLLKGSTTFVPSRSEETLTIPRGVEVRVKLAEGTRPIFDPNQFHYLKRVGELIPWQPGPDGTMALRVPPDLPTLALEAHQHTWIDGRSTTAPVAAGAVAVREGATLLLEPLPR